MTTKKRNLIKMIVIIVVALIAFVVVFAKAKHVSKLSWGMHKTINQTNFSGKAISGYDALTYFTDNKAAKGTDEYTYEWKGAKWLFTSQKHLDSFKTSPEKYAPRFGGYCSFAVSTGFTGNTDPEVWEIINGKLYLFSDKSFKEKWMLNPTENLAKCEKNWNN